MPGNVLTVTGRRTPLLLNIEKKVRPPSERPRLAVDAMGSDAGPAEVVAGVAKALANGLCADVSFFGDGDMVGQIVNGHAQLASATVVHADSVVQMTDKPMHVLRRGRDTSMWAAVTAVSQGAADAVLSGGNTGALMAVARRQIGMIKGVERPAITALWPSPKGRVVVLDVGANVDASDRQLVSFAIMGEAFFRALTGKLKPSVGLLNVGAEELKGHDTVRSAAALLRRADAEMAFQGFVEGNDISEGVVDVVVTDGFTGNVALKSAEGAARLVGGWMKEALTGSLISKLSAALMGRELKSLRQKIDPSSVNGGVFLGINGIVVKSHGGANASGVASAASMAAALTGRGFRRDVADNVGRVFATLDAASTGQDANTDQQSSGIKAVV